MARRRRRGQNPRPYEENGRWKFKYRIDQAQTDGTIRRVQKTKVLGRTDELNYSGACQEARKFIQPIDDLTPGIEFRDRTMTQLIAAWREAVAPTLKKSTQCSYEWAFKRIEPAFGVTPIAEIERSQVQRFLVQVGKALAPESLHDLRARLRGLLSVAFEWGWITANPASGRLRLPKRTRKRQKRLLTPAQFQALVLVLAPPDRLVVMLAVLAGLRKGEIEALRWSDVGQGFIIVDEASYFGTLDTPKTARSHRKVSIGPLVQHALDEWRRMARFTGPDDFVFGIRTNTPIDLQCGSEAP